jgi:3-oxoacyl-[acyl-carrier protein] reductase
VKQVLDRWGRVDVLINNAVQWSDRPLVNPPLFEELGYAEWQGLFRQNSEAAYAMIQRVLPSMRARKWGRIVNVSSGIAVDGMPGAGPYAAAKGALHGLTRTLCKELGPAGILVNVVMPGLTLTDAMKKRLSADFRAHAEKMSPIRRLLSPEEVVPLMTFLCSPLNTAVTGEIIRASGGIT